jgi:PPOX class probable F420-dependent enzyme
MRVPEHARTVLESDALGHLVTINPDGSPQVSVIWVGLDGDEIIAAHVPNNQKVKNIRRDGRVALSVETDRMNEMGLTEYLVITGTARITEGGAVDVLRKLAKTYIGPEADFLPGNDLPPGYVTHITIDRISGVGPWAS